MELPEFEFEKNLSIEIDLRGWEGDSIRERGFVLIFILACCNRKKR